MLALPVALLTLRHPVVKATPCPCNAFSTPTGQSSYSDASYELGFRFRPDVDGYINGVRFYKDVAMTGTHVGHLWANTGGPALATATFSETASGWQDVTFSSPVAVTAGTLYVASVSFLDNHYIATSNYFTTTVDNFPITIPSSSSVGNGVYNTTPGSFPGSNSGGATNYWVDISFMPSDPTPPVVTSVFPSDGAQNIKPGERPTVTFDDDMLPDSFTNSTVVATDSHGHTLSGAFSYDQTTKTMSFNPTDGFTQHETYTITLKGGSGTVIKNIANTAMAADYSWSFTIGGDSCPCSLMDRAAATSSQTGSDSAVEIGVKVRPSESGFITAIRFYKPVNSTATSHTGKIWSATGTQLGTATFNNESDFGWQEAKLSSPLAVIKDTTYIISYDSSDGRYVYSAGKLNGDIGNSIIKAYTSGYSENAATGSGNSNGVYKYTTGSYPSDGSPTGTYYWIDAVFTPYSATVNPLVVDSAQPADGSYGVPRATPIRARFNRPLDGSTINSASVHFTDSNNNAVSGTVGYDSSDHAITFTPSSSLGYATKYIVRIDNTVKDTDGLALANAYSWNFTVGSQLASDPSSGPGGPLLLITSSTNNYSKYYAEILRTEGLNYFDVKDISTVSATTLRNYNSAILSEMTLSQSQADMFSTWVDDGGDLVAMRPDSKLSSLLGVTSKGTTRQNQYMLVDTTTAPGKGIVGESMQFKGTGDNYTLNGASAVATYYSDASTSASDPAVTYRSVGSKGGTAAAFTYDLAKSVIALHQGNQAWVNNERDGSTPVRSNDLFFGAKSGDVQPDWVDLNKVHIPQADEQQRLLANVLTEAAKDSRPLPRFWYLPHDYKAAVILAGDDHGENNNIGTEHVFTNWLDYSPTGCSLLDWGCVRASGYVYTSGALTDARAQQFVKEGFDIGGHPVDGGVGSCDNFASYSSLNSMVTTALNAFRSKYSSLPYQRTTRYHCYVWSDWDSQPKADFAHDIRYDLNYVTYPASWIGNKAAIITGSGMNMRFTDTGGSLIDVRQGVTNFENTVTTGTTISTILDNATGSKGYYGIFGTHYDMSDSYDQTLYSNTASHNVPMISADQALTWLDGHGSSTFGNFTGSAGQYGFTVAAAEGAVGLRAMMPMNDAGGTISSLKLAGNTVGYQTQTVKGVSYAVFDAIPGNYTVTYSDYDPNQSTGSGTGTTQNIGQSSQGGQPAGRRANSHIFSNDDSGLQDATPQTTSPVGSSQNSHNGSTNHQGGKEIVQQSGSKEDGSSLGAWIGGAMLVVFVGGIIIGLVVRVRHKHRPTW